jgi:2-polyprenyl-3-methyl-5-hydroxy-6-metoxy-1,4-benzoquinol methylase
MQLLDNKTILGWDVHNWSKALAFWESLLSNKEHLSCLEIGANKGGLSLWLASKGYRVTCTDVTEMSDEIKASHKQYPFSKNISYEVLDATNIPYTGHFDVVVLKSVLGGIGRNRNIAQMEKVISEIYKCLKPGGLFLFAENVSGTKMHSFFRKNFGAKSWYFLHQQELKHLLEKFQEKEIHTTGFLGALGLNEKMRNLFGKTDDLFFSHLPSGWNYMAYGYAKK